MTQVEKMRKAIGEVREKFWGKTKMCHMSCIELCDLYETAQRDAYIGVTDAFDYGFIKGVRYQKAQEKKKRKVVKA